MKIICIGRNFHEHAQEMQSEVSSSPVLFLKPESALTTKTELTIPDFTTNLHYEAELVVKIGKEGKNITKETALGHVESIGLGIDFTARDLQSDLKKKGLPWEKAKAFDQSALISTLWIPIEKTAPLNDLHFSLQQNGKTVQEGKVSDMVFSIEDIIADASRYFLLEKGDLVFMGTPSGVGKINANDSFKGFLNDELFLNFCFI